MEYSLFVVRSWSCVARCALVCYRGVMFVSCLCLCGCLLVVGCYVVFLVHCVLLDVR